MISNTKAGDAPTSSNTSTHAAEVQHEQHGLSRLELNNQYFGHGSNSKPSSASAANTDATSSITQEQQLSQQAKKKRNLPGNPDPTSEVIALSPKSLMTTNRFVCEICNKGFQRDQNLQLHRRGHNLPWKLQKKASTEVLRRKVYICPQPSCVHHNPSRALGDLTGIKKHYCRKHGEKKWKCDKCSRKYAVRSDLKAHSKICGTREYKCDCGTIFSRRDNFITHRAFCDALQEDNNKVNPTFMTNIGANLQGPISHLMSSAQMNNNNIAQTTGISEFHLSNDIITQLSSPQELMHMNPKSLSMARSMFASSSSTSCLKLKSENNSSSQLTTGFQENGRLTHMSATDHLVHEATQMTQNNNMDPQSAYGGMQLQHDNSFDHAQFMGVMSSTGFTANMNQQEHMRKGSCEIYSQLFASDHLGMSSRNFDNRNDNAMLKNLENVTKFGDGGNGNTTTVDFLGLGGMTMGNFQQLQKQEMEFENIWSG